MGRVRTKTVKRASRAIIEKYYGKMTKDFHFNKRIIDDIAVIQSKRMRNKIAGYTTHLMKRIEKGPVRGISLKLQEEERERKMDFIPEKSEIQISNIKSNDPHVKDLIRPWHQATCQPTQPKKARQKLSSLRQVLGKILDNVKLICRNLICSTLSFKCLYLINKYIPIY